MKKSLFAYIATAWILFITWVWFQNHSIHEFNGQFAKIQFARLFETGEIWRAIMPILIILIIYGLYIVARWLIYGEANVKIKNMTCLKLVGLTSLIGLVAWNIAAFLPLMSGANKSAIAGAKFLSANLHFIGYFASLVIWISIVLLVWFSTGAIFMKFFKKLEKDSSQLMKALLRISIGLGIWSLIIFFFGWIGIYQWWLILFIALIFIVVSAKELWSFLRDFCFKKWEIAVSAFGLQTLMLIFLLFLFAINLVDIIRPIPIGWDDLGFYLNRAQLIANRGALVPGSAMFPMELLMSLGYKFFGSAILAMAISWIGGLLGAIAIFAFGRRFWDAKVGLIAATIWYTMPMIAHISFADMKVDPMLFFVSTIAIWCFLEWILDYKRLGWLYLVGLLTGIAWTIKITTAFLMIGLASVFIYHLFIWKAKWFSKLKTACIVALMFLIPFAPWVIYNMSTKHWQMPRSISDIISSDNSKRVVVADSDWEKIGIDKKIDCLGTGNVEEVGRYTGNLSGIVKYVRLPWDATMNIYINDLYVIIGFLFLALIPIWLFYVPKFREMKIESKTLLLFTAVYWIFWSWQGMGISWYGIVMFLPMSVAVAILAGKVQKPLWFKYFLAVIVILSVLANLVLRSDRFGNQVTASYAGGEISNKEFIEQVLPSYNEISAMVEKYPGKVWRIGTFIPYFIKNNDRLLMEDNQLDVFKCLDTGENDSATLDRIRKLGFSYFILDLNVATIEQNMQGTLHQKARRFVEFANKNLEILINNPQRGIAFMKVPGNLK
ncbi:MAG: glycosyltransferase family 39 protein [Patescibacteria group bacterium]|nr:glycosyltransferase family 39 protein [Patescibacteria group bacterium]